MTSTSKAVHTLTNAASSSACMHVSVVFPRAESDLGLIFAFDHGSSSCMPKRMRVCLHSRPGLGIEDVIDAYREMDRAMDYYLFEYD